MATCLRYSFLKFEKHKRSFLVVTQSIHGHNQLRKIMSRHFNEKDLTWKYQFVWRVMQHLCSKIPMQWITQFRSRGASSKVSLKAEFNNVFALNKIWAAWSYMLSVSLIRCTNEALKNNWTSKASLSASKKRKWTSDRIYLTHFCP